jgi:hypothetical protein
MVKVFTNNMFDTVLGDLYAEKYRKILSHNIWISFLENREFLFPDTGSAYSRIVNHRKNPPFWVSH